ncbi:MAG: hypothetical protein ACKO1N_08910, partial [Erythrobacter sp.]
MAQLVLTVAGAWAGNAIGGGLGQAAGAMLGSYLGAAIEQDLFGPGPAAVTRSEGARVTDLQVSGSAYGQPIPKVWGRGRIAANIIWVRGIKETAITETETTGGGGKGGASRGGRRQTTVRTRYEYSADILLGVCEGPVTAVYRIWVNNTMLDPEHVGAIRVGYGEDSQQADPLVAAVEGAGRTPAHRGLVTVMLEDFKLTPFGNRFPNFEVEVYRGSDDPGNARHLVEGVCLIPASGEFVTDTEIVRKVGHGSATSQAAINANTGTKRSDFLVSIDNLKRELPNVEWINFVYAWFGTSIDVATCDLVPKCEYAQGQSGAVGAETSPHLWSVAGGGRSIWPVVTSYTLPNGQSALSYGGTISDGSVIRAVQELKARGYKVLFYPFIMMDIPPPDPAPF